MSETVCWCLFKRIIAMEFWMKLASIVTAIAYALNCRGRLWIGRFRFLATAHLYGCGYERAGLSDWSGPTCQTSDPSRIRGMEMLGLRRGHDHQELLPLHRQRPPRAFRPAHGDDRGHLEDPCLR